MVSKMDLNRPRVSGLQTGWICLILEWFPQKYFFWMICRCKSLSQMKGVLVLIQFREVILINP